MAHNTSSSDSDNEITTRAKLFEHEKPIHEILGGGKVADILLWRNRNLSALLLLGMTVIWFLLEIVEYSFMTLICHISIIVMLALFLWSMVADILEWNRPPKLIEVILMSLFIDDTGSSRFKLLLLLAILTHPPFFLQIIISLCIMSVIGSYFSFVNLLYIGFLCMQTLPFVYEHYEEEINNLFGDMILVLRKKYKRFGKKYLKKIPRGSVKEKKTK